MEAVHGDRQLSKWRVEHSIGGAGEFHHRDPPPGRLAVFHEVERPTLVLGSAQDVSAVEVRVADRLGIDVVSRRSGGAAVLLMPSESVWLDLSIGPEDPLWRSDVAEAMIWVGEVWRRALRAVGVDASVHRGAMLTTPWSVAVCFAGIGPGEVVGGSGSKIVGVSQRRTRSYARFQTVCHLRWRPELVAALVAEPRPRSAELTSLVESVTVDRATLVASLAAALP